MLPIPGDKQTRGFTESERYLAKLCESSFLSLWSHPNVFKKRNRELCDLLVVFGDDVIVFSDKSCGFGDGDHAWTRWHRRSIEESVHQLHQAARWIRTYPAELFLDPLAQERFPFEISKNPRIHLVAVSLGASAACRARRRGGSGSLCIAPALPKEEPFHIGDVGFPKDFVHVFDDVSLDLVMRELNTAADFIEYLAAKERLIRAGELHFAGGEEDLLGESECEHFRPPRPSLAIVSCLSLCHVCVLGVS